MNLLAIDPGPASSAFVAFDTAHGLPTHWEKVDNHELAARLRCADRTDRLVVEMIASYGMPVGREVFETCVWLGRFIEAWHGPFDLVYRQDVKLYLCGDTRAKDANIRAALIDRFGPGKAAAIGLKKTPGPLYGMTGDCWSALAVAVTAAEALKKDASPAA